MQIIVHLRFDEKLAIELAITHFQDLRKTLIFKRILQNICCLKYRILEFLGYITKSDYFLSSSTSSNSASTTPESSLADSAASAFSAPPAAAFSSSAFFA